MGASTHPCLTPFVIANVSETSLPDIDHVVVDLSLLRVAVEGSDNPITLDQPCQASLPPD